ncbi:MAG TPA: protease pro-enzyme activation domain-containing protein [Verrucomicrobiae bacterium]
MAALIFCALVITAFSAEPGRRILPGHVPAVLAHLTPQGRLPGTNQLRLAIGLPLRNQDELNELLRQLGDPASPNFRKYLTPEEFTARFGPTEADYAMVKEFARTNGLAITATHANRLLLDVAGPVTAVEKAFHITLRTYRHPREARMFFAPDVEPTVDMALPVVDVQGLSDFSRPHPNLIKKNINGLAPKYGSAPDGISYFGNDFRSAYVPGTALNGAGQMVGLLQFDGFYSNDIAAYASAAGGGRTNIPIQTVLLDSYSGGISSVNGNAEVSLDIEMAMAMAPALTKIIVFEGNPTSLIPNDVLNAMAASNSVKNLSSSWGWSGGPTTTTDNIFKTMAAQGQSYFNATGDSDAFPSGFVDNSSNTTTPSSSPYITQVGGTTLSTPGGGGAYSSETVWNRNNGIGSSGGISTYYSIPIWQQGINSFLSNGGSVTARNIPDVALTAEYCYVKYGNGSGGSFGGTSCAAPLWAGFMALVNQQAVTNGQLSAGFINPAIYEIANESDYNAVFHDTTVGNNTNTTSTNAFFAVPNYDLCTGLGSPNGTNFINALLNPDPLVVVSNAGFNALGTITENSNPTAQIFNLTTQTFNLTNVSATPLDWSLINTSAWLNVSSAGGTLGAGAGAPVAVSLNTVASNLNVGTYSASIWFSNVTSGVGHARFFTLIMSDELLVSPTNFSTFIGTSAGTFNLASQTIHLTNAGSASLTWSLVNTSSWLNVSSVGGTLGAGASVSVVVSPNNVASNLNVGTYTADIMFSNLTTGVSQLRQITLQASDPLAFLPTNNFLFIGLSGGPFAPASQTIVLTNARAGSLNWSLNNTSTWFNVSPTSGSLSFTAQTNVTFTLTSAATNLPNGTYAAVFQVTNLTSQFVQTITGSISINRSLVPNGGFETGDFTGWTLNGNGGQDDFVADSSSVSGITPHTGSYYAAMGQAGSQAYLLQTLPTISGQKYLISLWLYNPTNATSISGFRRPVTVTNYPNEFSVSWNGGTLYDNVNFAKTSWTNLQFVVAASGSSTVLQIGGRDDLNYLGLDDVTLTPGFSPVVSVQPTNLTLLSGATAIFTTAVIGSTNFVYYQWRKNGTNISGATSNVLTLTAVTTNSNAGYTLYATNLFGAITSSVANLTVVLPPSITSSSLTNRTIQCGSNTNIFTITTAGTTPLFIQWQTNGAPAIGATNLTFALTNLHFASITNVAVVITNLYASLISNAVLTVQDTLAPVITLNSTNLFYIELGSTFTDPGASATDACAGSLSVIVSGVVNTNSVSTNTVFYTATDGFNNVTNTRTVIVRDTTPPTILWSFTNLIGAANSNCVALMTNVTGTNFILATDLSGALTITQSPTNNFILPLGTNTVVITVADASGNAAYSTNTIIVQDQTPPTILSQPQSQTNFIGSTATFNFAAIACTPLTFQWYSNNSLTIFTNTTLTLSNLAESATGNYFAVASANGGATTSAVVMLTVNLYPPTISSGVFSFNDGFNLNLSGSPGYTYILEATTNLLPSGNWLPLATNTPGTNGVWQFTDPSATNIPFQFYRLKLAP